MVAEPRSTVVELMAEQERIGRLRPEVWRAPDAELVAAGCFVAFRRGEQGPGHRGDRAWVGTALVAEGGEQLATALTTGTADDSYRPGLLALREIRLFLAGFRELLAGAVGPSPDVLLVDATGRDHPRRCGVALHVGHDLGIPSVGVTHRLLSDAGAEPPNLVERGESSVVLLGGEPVAAWVCTCTAVRPVVAHAGWRTDVDTAVDAVLRTSTFARTPEPLRAARCVAREARSAGEWWPPPPGGT